MKKIKLMLLNEGAKKLRQGYSYTKNYLFQIIFLSILLQSQLMKMYLNIE